MIVVITGVMAAGKSTVAQRLAERLPRSAHVRGDVFRRMIVSGRAELGTDLAAEAVDQLWLRYRLAAGTADAYADAGFTTIVQDVILGPDLPRFLDLLRTRPVHVVVLAPDPATVERRERERAKSGYGEWTVADLDRSLRSETPRIGQWIDTSGQTPDETVDAILAALPDRK
ncbi:AAA family ATPase [Actinoplanes sp. NPDC049548]|uniref:AAA family ATPase n=1 Tax=Actinoplanes sp. NPDC049548 TaxID=3155152 RepID=UPI0034465A8B